MLAWWYCSLHRPACIILCDSSLAKLIQCRTEQRLVENDYIQRSVIKTENKTNLSQTVLYCLVVVAAVNKLRIVIN